MVSEPDIDLPGSDELRAGQREVYGVVGGSMGGAEQGQRAQALSGQGRLPGGGGLEGLAEAPSRTQVEERC